MNFTGVDHFVLTVDDVEESCAFYEGLGAEIVMFGDGRKAVRFGEQKINLHPVENDIDPVSETPIRGGGDFCVLTDASLEDVERQLRDQGIDVIKGPIAQPGAVGPITSVYFRDPDGNLVEIGTYSG